MPGSTRSPATSASWRARASRGDWRSSGCWSRRSADRRRALARPTDLDAPQRHGPRPMHGVVDAAGTVEVVAERDLHDAPAESRDRQRPGEVRRAQAGVQGAAVVEPVVDDRGVELPAQLATRAMDLAVGLGWPERPVAVARTAGTAPVLTGDGPRARLVDFHRDGAPHRDVTWIAVPR